MPGPMNEQSKTDEAHDMTAEKVLCYSGDGQPHYHDLGCCAKI